jgi:hypothetical protein
MAYDHGMATELGDKISSFLDPDSARALREVSSANRHARRPTTVQFQLGTTVWPAVAGDLTLRVDIRGERRIRTPDGVETTIGSSFFFAPPDLHPALQAYIDAYGAQAKRLEIRTAPSEPVGHFGRELVSLPSLEMASMQGRVYKCACYARIITISVQTLRHRHMDMPRVVELKIRVAAGETTMLPRGMTQLKELQIDAPQMETFVDALNDCRKLRVLEVFEGTRSLTRVCELMTAPRFGMRRGIQMTLTTLALPADGLSGPSLRCLAGHSSLREFMLRVIERAGFTSADLAAFFDQTGRDERMRLSTVALLGPLLDTAVANTLFQSHGQTLVKVQATVPNPREIRDVYDAWQLPGVDEERSERRHQAMELLLLPPGDQRERKWRVHAGGARPPGG